MARMLRGTIVGAVALVAYGCGPSDSLEVRARDVGSETPFAQQTPPSSQAAGQVLVTCEPHQQAVIRQVGVGTDMTTRVECVGSGTPTGWVGGGGAAVFEPPYNGARVVPAVATVPPAPRQAVTEHVVYQPAPAREAPPSRSAARSAVIIGSSAGAGAGVGAIVGGKKGAVVGAAIGGGGALIWDQATRRK